MEIYRGIAGRLSLDPARDEESARILNEILKKKETISEASLRSRVNGRDVVVYGAGPSLENGIDMMLSSGLYNNFLHAAADGAVTAFIERGKYPEMVFSDLDGPAHDLIKASSSGSWIVAHAHGDNIPLVKNLIPMLKGRLLGSTQVIPIPPLVLNLGGFTDGDRAAYWADGLGASRIILVGMDFGEKIGRYSKRGLTGERLKRKIEKLKIGSELVGLLTSRRELLNLSGAPLSNSKTIDFNDLAKIIKR
jgi:uncharacterized Rossmann fold enzyme